jgi:uncharacterized membrane protein YhaH (DUF805 family)
MNPSSLRTSAARLARGPFAAAVIVVYLLSFASQVLLSGPVTMRLGVVPFLAAQGVLIWLWIVLHQRRLHDAGRPTGTVFGVASVYDLSIILLVLLVWFVLSSTAGTVDGVGPHAGILQLFVVFYLLGSMSGDSSLGALQIWLVGFAALMLLPVAIALGFSVWAATRPSGESG